MAVNTFGHTQAGHGGPADSRRRGADRTRRRDPHPRPQRDARVLRQAARRPPRRSIRTAGSTPATSACSTPRATSGSPTGRRTSSSRRAARTSRPQPIENLAKTSKFVSNAVMLGDRRPFPIMLVVPERRAAQGLGRARRAARRRHRAAGQRCPRCRPSWSGRCGRRSATSPSSRCPRSSCCCRGISAWRAGELTPTLKVQAADRGGAAPGGDRGALRRAASEACSTRLDATARRAGAYPDPVRRWPSGRWSRAPGPAPRPPPGVPAAPHAPPRAPSRIARRTARPSTTPRIELVLSGRRPPRMHADPGLVGHLGRRIDRHQAHARAPAPPRRATAPPGRRPAPDSRPGR